MSANSIAARGRAAAEAKLMTDTCVITNPGLAVLNRVTHRVEYPTAAIIYSGKCRLRPDSAPADVDARAGEATSAQVALLLSVPFGEATAAEVGHQVQVTSQDPRAGGSPSRLLYIRGIDEGTHITARRFQLTEISP